jgi:hypothetical protein
LVEQRTFNPTVAGSIPAGGTEKVTGNLMFLQGLALARWNAINGALLQMVGSIQHSFTQDLQEIQRLNQQWQSFSNQVANFDDVLNNQQLTQDPTTGTYYYAPYDSYEADGPNGPGYYYHDQRLNIINRPT